MYYISFRLMLNPIPYALWSISIHIWISPFLNYSLMSWQEPIRKSNSKSFQNLKISTELIHPLHRRTTYARLHQQPTHGYIFFFFRATRAIHLLDFSQFSIWLIWFRAHKYSFEPREIVCSSGTFLWIQMSECYAFLYDVRPTHM